jgi:GAF domain-containing protein
MDELIALAGVVLMHQNLPETLAEVCRIAVRAVPGADGVSITIISGGKPEAIASDEWSRGFDEMQYTEQEGPCLDAYRTGNAFRIRDLGTDLRWPTYAPRAVEHGARSMLVQPLIAQSTTVGALNVYGREPDAFDAEAAAIAAIVAAHAGLASQVAAAFFGHRQLADNMIEAMRSRAVIEQAKGIIMATVQCDADAAFQELVRAARQSQRKVREVANTFVARAATGDL